MRPFDGKATFRSAAVCAIAGVNSNTLKHWVGRGVLQLEAPPAHGWTTYTARDLIRICAWAEVNVSGIPPTKARGLVNVLEQDLLSLAFDRPEWAALNTPIDLSAGRFIRCAVLGGVDEDADAVRFSVGVTNRRGAMRWLETGGMGGIVAATTIFVDVGRVWTAVQARLEQATRGDK